MKNLYKDVWNQNHKRFKGNKDNIMKYDNWLDDFEKIIEKTDTKIIDLGCGVTGNNTLWLFEKNKKVISCDYAEEALNTLKENIPDSDILLFDMIEKFPFNDNYTDLVIADLSLHYFSLETTKNIIGEIKRVLKPNGHLIFRVNSVNSTEFKNVLGEKLEDKFYKTDQMKKRFFDEESIMNFFKDWNIEYLEEQEMNRWASKIIWKCCAKNNK